MSPLYLPAFVKSGRAVAAAGTGLTVVFMPMVSGDWVSRCRLRSFSSSFLKVVLEYRKLLGDGGSVCRLNGVVYVYGISRIAWSNEVSAVDEFEDVFRECCRAVPLIREATQIEGESWLGCVVRRHPETPRGKVVAWGQYLETIEVLDRSHLSRRQQDVDGHRRATDYRQKMAFVWILQPFPSISGLSICRFLSAHASRKYSQQLRRIA